MPRARSTAPRSTTPGRPSSWAWASRSPTCPAFARTCSGRWGRTAWCCTGPGEPGAPRSALERDVHVVAVAADGPDVLAVLDPALRVVEQLGGVLPAHHVVVGGHLRRRAGHVDRPGLVVVRARRVLPAGGGGDGQPHLPGRLHRPAQPGRVGAAGGSLHPARLE